MRSFEKIASFCAKLFKQTSPRPSPLQTNPLSPAPNYSKQNATTPSSPPLAGADDIHQLLHRAFRPITTKIWIIVSFVLEKCAPLKLLASFCAQKDQTNHYNIITPLDLPPPPDSKPNTSSPSPLHPSRPPPAPTTCFASCTGLSDPSRPKYEVF